MKTPEALVDPDVCRTKFEAEVAEYRKHENDYISRGWWMVQAVFPKIFMVFGTPTIKPPMVAFGAILDFTNYDFWPPSVKIVNPFTQEPYKGNQLPIPPLPRRRSSLIAAPAGEPDAGQLPAEQVLVDHLLQFEDPEAIPFICVPGIREYHEHPAHSGDSWFLHRKRGEGTLYFVLNLLGTYGIGAIKGLGVQLQIAFQGPNSINEISQ